MVGKTGAGEGIRTLDPNLGKRKIGLSLQFAPMATIAPRYAEEQGGGFLRTLTALEQSGCSRTAVQTGDGDRAVTGCRTTG